MSAFRPSRYKALWKALTLGHLFKKLLPIFRSLKTSSRHARWRTKQLLDNLRGSINCVTLEVLTTRKRVKASKALLFYVTRSGKTRNSAEHKILAKEIGYLASGFFFLKQCIVDLKNTFFSCINWKFLSRRHSYKKVRTLILQFWIQDLPNCANFFKSIEFSDELIFEFWGSRIKGERSLTNGFSSIL